MVERSKIKIVKDLKYDIAILKITGAIDNATIGRFKNSIEEIINKGIYRIVIDFKNVNYLSSSGVGVMMSKVDYLRKKGGDMLVINLSGKIKKIFELLDLQAVFKIIKSESEIL